MASATIPSTGTVDIPIRAFQVLSPGAAAFTLTIGFDSTVIEVTDVLPGDAPFGGGLFNFNIVTGAGVVKISDLHTKDGKTGDFVLAKLRVRAVGASGTSDLTLTIDAFIYPNSNNIPARTVDGSAVVQ